MPLTAGARLGPYEIVRLLGSGGMGDVYEARDPRLSRHVAVKVLPPSVAGDPASLRRFEQESRMIGMLNHPNIVMVHDVGADATSPYLVTELLDGDTLRKKLRAGAIPVEQARHLAAQIARGLAAAHAKGIVHRDLKPENIIVDRQLRAKILDFGIAKLAEPSRPGVADDDGETHSVLTRVGEVIGTLGYMSPEQVTGKAADPRSDLFSLGAILYEMVSGRRAFQEASPHETAAAILKDEPALAADVPPEVAAVIGRCLAKNPDDRYQSASDLAFQLDGLLTLPVAASRPSRSRRGLWLAAVAAVTAVGAAIAVGTRYAAPPDSPVSYERLTFRKGMIHSARFAPDGQTVIYSATWDGEANELFSMRLQSPESRALGHRDADLLAVSASGELALSLRPNRRGPTRGTLARVGLAGNTPRLLLDNVVAADWSTDGDLGAVHVVGGKYRVEFPIGSPLYQTTEPVTSFRVSPDASRVALFEGSAVTTIDRRGERQVLSSGWVLRDRLAWSPDGREVWFTAAPLVPTIATATLYAVTLDGTRRVLARVPEGISLLDISGEGRVLATTSHSSKGLRFYSNATGLERDLTWFDWGLVADLSRDQKFLLFSEGGHAAGRDRDAYLRGTDGSPAVRLSDGSALALSPDGTRALVLKSLDGMGRLVSDPPAPATSER